MSSSNEFLWVSGSPILETGVEGVGGVADNLGLGRDDSGSLLKGSSPDSSGSSPQSHRCDMYRVVMLNERKEKRPAQITTHETAALHLPFKESHSDG